MKCCVRHATVYRPPRLGSIDCADAAASVAHSPRFIADPKSSIGAQCSAVCRCCFTAALRCPPARQSLCVVRLCNCHAASHAARCVAYCVARLHSILQLCNVQRVACHGLCAASHGASIRASREQWHSLQGCHSCCIDAVCRGGRHWVHSLFHCRRDVVPAAPPRVCDGAAPRLARAPRHPHFARRRQCVCFRSLLDLKRNETCGLL